MKFKIHETTAEVDNSLCKLDTVALEKYIDSSLSDNSFGSSIDVFHFGFELFPFDGKLTSWFEETKDILRYSWKNKYLLSIGQVDWNKYKRADAKGQYKLVKESILDSIQNLQHLKKKPKDFNFLKFEEEITQILNNYYE